MASTTTGSGSVAGSIINPHSCTYRCVSLRMRMSFKRRGHTSFPSICTFSGSGGHSARLEAVSRYFGRTHEITMDVRMPARWQYTLYAALFVSTSPSLAPNSR